MKLKSLLLGSAAGLFAVTGAQAADLAEDLPVAEPVEYVRVCDAFGAGFFYIPGTDTCLKVGGRVRVEAHYTHGFDDDNNFDRGEGEDFDGRRGRTRIFEPVNEASPDETRGYNNFTTRARGYINVDARTQTDFGVVRAYVQYYLTNGPAVGPADNLDYSVTGPTLDEAFVSLTNDFGVFTAGHTFTKFDFFRGYAFDTIIGSDDPSDNVTLFAYTFTAAQGFSATISVEDPRTIGRDVFFGEATRLVAVDPDDDNVPTTFATVDEATPDGIHGGQRTPDLVGNLAFDGGFGSAQIMGVLHDVRMSEFAVDNAVPGADGDTELGYAFGAGATLKVPNTNIEASLQGVYGEGAIGYVTTGNGAPVTDGIVQRVSRRVRVVDADGNVTFRNEAFFTDDIDLTEAYAINAGVSVGLTETITASITGSYADVEFGDDGDDSGNRSGRRGNSRFGGAFTPRLSEDYDTYTLSGNLSVTPIAGLLAGIEIEYENVDFDNSDEGRRRGGNGDIDFGDDDNDDEDDRWGGMVRIQRTF